MQMNHKFLSGVVPLLLAAGILLGGCTGAKGDVYLAYSWTSMPLYLYDENPSIPSTVYNGTYYQTNEGSYYMEYTAWDDSSWWMIYTITANPGEAFFQDGLPAYFEIALYSFGPSIYQWSEPRSAGEDQSGEPAETNGSASGSDSEPASPAGRSDSGTETIVRGGYTLTIEWGRME